MTCNLSHLDATDNIKYSVDFRSVYQEILGGHLGAEAREILGGAFDKLQLVRQRVLSY